MNVNPGKLDKKINIVKVTKAKDADGFEIETESTVRECWAQVSRVSGTELTKANAEFSDVKTRFLIRYSTILLDTDMKILYGNKYYDIKFLNEYGDSREYVEILADRLELV